MEQVFKIGSMEPGAMLYDASKEFEASDYKLQVDLTVRHTVSLFVEFLLGVVPLFIQKRKKKNMKLSMFLFVF